MLLETPVVLLGLAVLLGFKHSFDADHLIAVSNIIARSASKQTTIRLSISWAAGHMFTAAVLTFTLYALNQTLLQNFLANLQHIIPAMLFAIGFIGLLVETSYYHQHVHRHRGEEHSHSHFHPLGRLIRRSHELGREPHRVMAGIGIIHGLAGNDELLILFAVALEVTSLPGLLLGVGAFSVGVVGGMIFYGLALSLPILRHRGVRMKRVVNVTLASLSIVYATLLILGIESSLFPSPLIL